MTDAAETNPLAPEIEPSIPFVAETLPPIGGEAPPTSADVTEEVDDTVRRPAAPADATAILRRWKVAEVEAMLGPAFGMIASAAEARGLQADARPTDDELHQIAVPLTAIINRNSYFAQLASRGDWIALALATGGWGWRVYGDEQQIARDVRRSHADAARAANPHDAQPPIGWNPAA